MQIKKFKARTMTKALKKVKNEFGSDAVILSARNIKQKKNIFLKTHNNLVEVTAAIGHYIPTININNQKTGIIRDRLFNQNSSNSHPHKNDFDEGKSIITKPYFKSNEEEQANRLTNTKLKELLMIYQQMVSQHVDTEDTIMIVRELKEIYKNSSMIESTNVKINIKNILNEMGVSDNRIKLQKGNKRIVAFVGKSGVGKTTTAAKIAALGQSYLKSNEVGMISLDDSRIGAFEQTRIYADIIGFKFETATSQSEFSQAIKKLDSMNLILIDTPGINPRMKMQLQKIADYLTKYNPIEIHLVMSANDKIEDMKDSIDLFNFISISHLIFTKLDETISYGNILSQLIHTKLPVSYFTWGHRVPEDIENASLTKLIDQIFEKYNFDQKFNGAPESIAENLNVFENMINGKIETNSLNNNVLSKMSMDSSAFSEQCVSIY